MHPNRPNRAALIPLIVAIVALMVFGLIRDEDKRKAKVALEAKQKFEAEYKAATQTIYLKSWETNECGILRKPTRECSMTNWPGRVYPDQPLPGDKTPGIVWTCNLQQGADKRFPPQKVCFADASEERKRAYPCPNYIGNRIEHGDKGCARAPGSERFNGGA